MTTVSDILTMTGSIARDSECMTRDQLVVAFNKLELARAAHSIKSLAFINNKRLTDPEYMKVKAARDNAYKIARYHKDPIFRATTIARAKATNAKTAALKSIRYLFMQD